MGIYIVDELGSTKSLQRHHCSNEVKELHEVVKLNHDMLPGDQIDPVNPRRWLLVKHEMPVADPGSGSDRWSLDLFFLDQDAVPTFVECKRFSDTRSRREVVAQMIDYAAYSHAYLDAPLMREYATATAKSRKLDLEDLYAELNADFSDMTDYFERAEQNLKDGRVRLVFLLEDSPHELRTLVTFLNNQMTRTEVMIVELKFYVLDGLKVVRPSLYGYTEQAYVMKKEVARKETRLRTSSFDSVDSFLAAMESDAGPGMRSKAETLIKRLEEAGADKSFGSKSCKISLPFLGDRALFTLYVNGSLYITVLWMDRQSREYQKVCRFAESFGVSLAEAVDSRMIKPKDAWCGRIDDFVEFLNGLTADR